VTPAKSPANEPIDAVYVWSGGEELRHSLRSLDKYAPWIRKVYVVTEAREPAWLKGSHPRLAFVKPVELVRDAAASADAVKWNLFRIPGLSRQFLCLDASFYLGKPLLANEFLTGKGGYRFFANTADVPSGGPAEALLNSRFGNRSPRRQIAPTPHLLDRSFLEEVLRLWEKNIKQGGVSMETLYFYFLAENPLQRGAHEKVALTDDIYGVAPLSGAGQVRAMLSRSPKFFRLEGRPSFMARVFLKLHYWRRSTFER
jgi:Stealth protein CR2, conserved region 2